MSIVCPTKNDELDLACTYFNESKNYFQLLLKKLYFLSSDTKILLFVSKLMEYQGSPFDIELMEDQSNMADAGA